MEPSNCQRAAAGVTSDPVTRKGPCLVLNHSSSQTLPFPCVAAFERLPAVEHHRTARVSHRARDGISRNQPFDPGLARDEDRIFINLAF